MVHSWLLLVKQKKTAAALSQLLLHLLPPCAPAATNKGEFLSMHVMYTEAEGLCVSVWRAP